MTNQIFDSLICSEYRTISIYQHPFNSLYNFITFASARAKFDVTVWSIVWKAEPFKCCCSIWKAHWVRNMCKKYVNTFSLIRLYHCVFWETQLTKLDKHFRFIKSKHSSSDSFIYSWTKNDTTILVLQKTNNKGIKAKIFPIFSQLLGLLSCSRALNPSDISPRILLCTELYVFCCSLKNKS